MGPLGRRGGLGIWSTRHGRRLSAPRCCRLHCLGTRYLSRPLLKRSEDLTTDHARYGSIQRCKAPNGMAPACCATTCPSRSRTNVGIDRTPNAAWVAGDWSTCSASRRTGRRGPAGLASCRYGPVSSRMRTTSRGSMRSATPSDPTPRRGPRRPGAGARYCGSSRCASNSAFARSAPPPRSA